MGYTTRIYEFFKIYILYFYNIVKGMNFYITEVPDIVENEVYNDIISEVHEVSKISRRSQDSEDDKEDVNRRRLQCLDAINQRYLRKNYLKKKNNIIRKPSEIDLADWLS